jgi:hypothetical protein
MIEDRSSSQKRTSNPNRHEPDHELRTSNLTEVVFAANFPLNIK